MNIKKLLSAIKTTRKTSPYWSTGQFVWEASYTDSTGSREFCLTKDLPEDATEVFIDIFRLLGPLGKRERNWVAAYKVRDEDGTPTLVHIR